MVSDITTFTNDLLLDFLDSIHSSLQPKLEDHYGSRWMEDGVRKHFKQSNFDRIEEMLSSPMRVVDMKREKSGLDLYGAEHLWQIVNGNWKGLFEDTFKNRIRTEACLGEITEVRHNLAHRHKHNVVLRSNVIRFVQNCRMLLVALETQDSDKFTAIEESLNTGGSPWGNPLAGTLPPSGEIYDEFVGRPGQLEELSEWFNSDNSAVLIWGYGGAGKSALAYKFAREIRDGSYGNLQAVCWVSAKKSEFVDGDTRSRPQDFHDLSSFIAAVWEALYGDSPGSLEPKELIKELNDTPTLLIIDDFDTVLYEDAELTEFLQRIRYSLSYPPTTRIIYTSRESNPLLNPQIEAPPFNDDELTEFVALRARAYNIEESAYADRIPAIRSVTQAYPLFVDDWVRHASIVGADTAISEWQHRRGDAAREYALRRQIERLPMTGSVDVLMSLSIANKPLVIPELSQVAGLTDDDTEKGILDLLNLRLAYKDPEAEPSEPAYIMNNNTSRLVQQTYKGDARLSGSQAAFKYLTGERVPAAKRRAIGRTIIDNMEMERRQGFEAALKHLRDNMTGELADSPDLYGQLGRLYGNQVKLYAERDQHDDEQAQRYCKSAREAFKRAARLGTRKPAVYEQWIEMEIQIAESMIRRLRLNRNEMITQSDVTSQWVRCVEIAEAGIERCGESKQLCHKAGYCASREGQSKNFDNRFTDAQSAYGRARQWFYKALDAPIAGDNKDLFNPITIYRGLVLALAELDQSQLEIQQVLSDFRQSANRQLAYENVVEEVRRKYPTLTV